MHNTAGSSVTPGTAQVALCDEHRDDHPDLNPCPWVVILSDLGPECAHVSHVLSACGMSHTTLGPVPTPLGDFDPPGGVVGLVLESGVRDLIQACRGFHRANPRVFTLAVVKDSGSTNLVALLDSGAIGCVDVDALSGDRGRHLLRAVACGECVLPRSLTRDVVAELRVRTREHALALLGLTKRELEIIQLMEQGLTTRQMADHFFVSAVTIRTHISAVYRKLGVKDRESALARVRSD